MKHLNIDISSLTPKTHTLSNGRPIYLFPDNNLEIVELDFAFNAGSCFESKRLAASVATKMLTLGTKHHTAEEIAEFLDFRGIQIELSSYVYSAVVSVFTLEKYIPELLPLLYEFFDEPTFPQDEIDLFLSRKRQMLRTSMQKTKYLARNLFYESLFGFEHPMGTYTLEKDFDIIQREDAISFFNQHFTLSDAILVMSGGFKERDLELYNQYFGHTEASPFLKWNRNPYPLHTDYSARHQVMPQAVQSSIRIGALLPFQKDSTEFAQFQVLNTLLGGYFGSRLMQNIREDKGYTYGINSTTQHDLYNCSFFIQTDVEGSITQDAVREIYHELDRLCHEPIPTEELDTVKQSMSGTFLRTIDGVFDRAERFLHSLLVESIQEVSTPLLLQTIETVTPAQLQAIAQQVFDKEHLLEIIVGSDTIEK